MAELQIEIALARRGFELQVALTLGAQTLAVIGRSGSGKSSLLRTVAGLERSSRGRIKLGGETWLDTDVGVNVRPEHRRVGYVPQDYGLFPHLTVARNVRFGGGGDPTNLLERLGIAHLRNARPARLSGGERQRVALARALARGPEVLLLDEPFAALDATTRAQVRNELGDQLRELSLPVLLVTHAFEDAARLAQQVAVIDDGRIVQVGTPAELLTQPARANVAALTGANCVDANATSDAKGSILALDGGGLVRSASRADGRVTLAIHPWELTICPPHDSTLTDQVLSVSPHAGGLAVELSRFTVHTRAGIDVSELAAPGTTVGLLPSPGGVHVLSR